jgi:hypothetical protein
MKKQRKPKQIQEANKYDKIIKENIEDVFIPLILNRYWYDCTNVPVARLSSSHRTRQRKSKS